MTKITDNPDGSKTVALEKPILTHAGEVRQVTLRQPAYDDYMALGDPTATILALGSVVPADDMGVIRAYVERLASVGPEHLAQIRVLADAMALAAAVKDFFRAASAGTSTLSPTPSSSACAGPSATSAA